ncbi:hypothetical protein [Paenibacillus sp. GCM10028914]|uniref:hypothetical protein n=1 Tax=Paenibacillus sp. GCM10028914 TaxID=3273416 RepID=UPI00360F0EA0
MKNKWIAGLGVAVLTLGIGTAVYAETNEMSFQEMLPFMKQMHPGASDQQLNEMYQDCHGNNNGMMQNQVQNREEGSYNGMMRSHHNGSMMWGGQAESSQDL